MAIQVWRGRHWLIGALVMVAVAAPMGAMAPAVAVTRPAAHRDGPDRTSAVEARRVDSVPTPKLAWRDCALPVSVPVPAGVQCADAWLPLDYDEPHGAKTKVAQCTAATRSRASPAPTGRRRP
jgi:hypothetical protein